MYVIVVYDVDTKRVAKVCKCLRQWLHWVQNSVFEGEITPARLREIKAALAGIIDPKHDSVLFYVISGSNAWQKEVMGVERLEVTNII